MMIAWRVRNTAGEVGLFQGLQSCLQGRACALLTMVCLLAVMGGCSSDSEKPANNQTPTTPASTTPETANAPTETDAAAAPQKTTPPEVSGIPFDVWPEVWFDDPVAVAGTTEPSPQTGPRQNPSVATTTGESTDPPMPPSEDSPAVTENSDQRSWEELIRGDDLQEEVKQIRLSMKQAFQSVQRYNGNYQQLQIDGSVLAALAMVAKSHPESLTWKPKGDQVRDLAAKLAAAATGLGRSYYEPAQKLYEPLDQLLSGNAPGNLPPPEEKARLDEFAPRGKLMRRLQRSEDFLKANGGNEASFRSEIEQMRHEALIVALLGRVTADHAYDLADQPEYETQSKALIQAGKDAAAAAEKMDFAAFIEARDRMTKACNACHLDFRFEEE